MQRVLGAAQQGRSVCASRTAASHPRQAVRAHFFGKRAQPGNSFSRKQYEDTLGAMLATAPAPPAHPAEADQGQRQSPQHQEQHVEHSNGHALHVVKPDKPIEEAPAQQNVHAAAASAETLDQQSAVVADKQTAPEVSLPVVSEPEPETTEAEQPVTAAELAPAPAANEQPAAPAAETQTVSSSAAAVQDAATEAAEPVAAATKEMAVPAKAEAETAAEATAAEAAVPAAQQQQQEAPAKTSKLPSNGKLPTGAKLLEQLEQAAGAILGQPEGRVLKPAKARTEPKTPASKTKKVPQATNPRNLVFVTAEVAPWSKTGGLGDVLGSLPVALAERGHRVMVVVPRYACYEEPVDTELRINIMGAEVGYFHYKHKGVDWVFVDHPSYPRPGGLYADEHGVYGDNQFRFMLLALASLEAPLQLPLGEQGLYGEDCVFIANDWHAALVPVYLAAKYRSHGVYTNARSVMAIHNLRHQGVFPPTTFNSLGLPSGWYNALEYQYPPHMRQGSFAEEGRSVNMLKGGITTADRVVTVSPGYAGEIRTWLGGWGLEGLLNARGPVLNGIVNGIDDEDWNPASDQHLPKNFNITNFKAGKRACKVALQEELGLPVNPDTPLIAFIGRLDYQKGADIVLQAAPWMMSQGVQLVCLGTGSTDLENGLRWLEAAYHDQARGWVGFNVAMSHKITAAADILLMPSRFEPCGLNQLYAMQYGTVPVAHSTGGLRDTVIDFNPEEQTGTGWTFGNCDASGLIHATGLALHTLREYPKDFEGIQLRGMQRDSTWNGAAEQYETIFEWALMDQPYA